MDFFLTTLSRVHARCGPLMEEAMSGHASAGVEDVARIAREVFKAQSGTLGKKALCLTEIINRLANPTTHEVDVDVVLDLVMDAWQEQRSKDEVEVQVWKF